MALSMSLRQTQSVEQKQEHALSLKQSQSLALQESMRALKGLCYPPADELAIIEQLLQKFLGAIKNTTLKDAIGSVFADENIKKNMLEQASLLSFPLKKNLNTFVYKYLFEHTLLSQQAMADISIDANDLFTKKNELDFIKAFENRPGLVDDTAKIEALIKYNIGNEAIVKEFAMKTKILNTVDEDMIKLAQNISQIVGFFLITKIKEENNDHRSNTLNFLREKIILEQIHDFVSERLLKRFLRKITLGKPRNPQANRANLKSSTINTIGEFMLISLGIISPGMFQLYKFSLPQEKIEDLMKTTNSTRDELLSVFQHYNLRGINGEPIFYNRRFTQNQVPSKESDDLVRDFLQKIKLYHETIFRGFGYTTFEEKIIEIQRDKTLDQQEKQDIIIEEMNARLGDEKFMKLMVQILAAYRYKDTYTLINPKK